MSIKKKIRTVVAKNATPIQFGTELACMTYNIYVAWKFRKASPLTFKQDWKERLTYVVPGMVGVLTAQVLSDKLSVLNFQYQSALRIWKARNRWNPAEFQAHKNSIHASDRILWMDAFPDFTPESYKGFDLVDEVWGPGLMYDSMDPRMIDEGYLENWDCHRLGGLDEWGLIRGYEGPEKDDFTPYYDWNQSFSNLTESWGLRDYEGPDEGVLNQDDYDDLEEFARDKELLAKAHADINVYGIMSDCGVDTPYDVPWDDLSRMYDEVPGYRILAKAYPYRPASSKI